MIIRSLGIETFIVLLHVIRVNHWRLPLANHKSAAKRARQSLRKTTNNSKTLNAVRTFEKKLRLALTSKDKEKATELLTAYTSKASKAAQKGVMKAETVSRKVSRLSKSLFSLNS